MWMLSVMWIVSVMWMRSVMWVVSVPSACTGSLHCAKVTYCLQQASKVALVSRPVHESAEEVASMDSLRAVTDAAKWGVRECFPYSWYYVNYETNKVRSDTASLLFISMRQHLLPCCRAASVLTSVKQSLQDRTDIWRNVTI